MSDRNITKVPSPPRPLEDVRVLAIEQFGAGPWATLQLADLGAEVIKIEDPAHGGDVARYVPPYQEEEDSLFFETFNRGKKSVALDLRTPSGRRVFEDLVQRVDAVYCNLRGDQPAKLRLTYKDLAPHNPQIVCCSLSGFGVTGPRAGEGAYDYIIQAMAGWMSVTGQPDGPPTKSGLSLVDFCGGYASVIALMAGVWQARRDGKGCDCDTSLFESALSLLTYVGTWTATAGYVPSRMGDSAHPSIVPFQAFETRDGWVTVACAKPKFWVAMCHAIGQSKLLDDARFADLASRLEHREQLLAILRPVFASHSTDGLVTLLAAAGVPAGAVNDVATALQDPQVTAREGVVSYEHPRFGTVRTMASPLRVTGARPAYEPAPTRGQHTMTTLADLCDYSAEELDALAAAGAFGAAAPSSAVA
jgi:crotonobetainyl-CoA:carnitine CoA-transferase CaiB-like acyl-CoA transferase